MKVMKKLFAIVLAVALVLTGIYFVPTDAEEVKATTTSTSEATYEVVGVNDVSVTDGIPVKEGYLFAGWFNSAECSLDTAVADKASATHAKFVKEDVLNVKLQISGKEIQDGDKNAYRAIRFISSVDSLDYSEVGFILNGDTENLYPITTVYEKIESTLYEVTASADGESEATTEKLEYAFSPKIVGTTSEYFFTAKMAISESTAENSNWNKDYTVQAYWKTLDGTVVTGEIREVNVSKDSGSRVLNMTLNGVLSANTTTDFTTSRMIGLTEDDKKVTDATVEVLASGSDYTNVRISWSDGITVNDLASATAITVGDASGIYRNYYTKYTGTDTEDTSWYEINTGATEFVVATAADLQGMAYLLTNKIDPFSSNTITLVGDVKVNSEVLVQNGVPTDAATSGTGLITWASIGDSNCNFQGTFDGDNNIISGLYINATAQNQGLFGITTKDSTIQNVHISNSYMVSTGARLGGIIGSGNGNVKNTYVDNDVYLSGAGTVGGIVGYTGAGTASISQSWFAGSAYSNAVYLGGIIGWNYGGNKTVSDCLFTGKLNSSNVARSYTGGIVGGATSTAVTTIRNCVSTGTVNSEQSGLQIGAVLGAVRGASDAGVAYELTMENVYTTNQRSYQGDTSYNFTTNTAADGLGNDSTNQSGIGVKGMATIVTDADLKGTSGYANTDLDFYSVDNTDGIWAATDNGPELKVFSSDTTAQTTFNVQRSNIDWYRAQYTNDAYTTSAPMTLPSKVTFEIDSEGDMNGFSAVANGTTGKTVVGVELEVDNFSGDTVKMTDDIALNSGWVPTVDSSYALTNGTGVHRWTTIASFSGTFDGDGHELSGVYNVATTELSGLFGTMNPGSAVQNLKLTDSYFINDISTSGNKLSRVGSIAGDFFQGKLSNVYSNAIVAVNGWCAGGFVGRYKADTNTTVADIENCWFDGTVAVYSLTATSQARNYFGGLVGRLFESSGLEPGLTNCLNSGAVLRLSTASQRYAGFGGIIGGCNDAIVLHMTNCLSVGTVNDYAEQDGSLIGRIGGASTLTLANCYATTQSCGRAFKELNASSTLNGATYNATTANATLLVDRANILLDAAKSSTGIPSLFAVADGETSAWVCDTVSNDTNRGTPILSYFAEWWKARQ